MNIINANNSGIIITPDSSNTLQIQTNSSDCLLVTRNAENYPIANFNSKSAVILPHANQTLPTSPLVGMMHYDPATGRIWVYKSTGWATFI
jgi:hypothetical protein